MHHYNVGYGTHEESYYVQLIHKNKYTKRQFERIVANSTVKLLKDYEKGNRVSFQDLIYSIVEDLIKNHGFKKLKYDAEFSVFGWPDILDEKDWDGDRGEQLTRLTRICKQKLQ